MIRVLNFARAPRGDDWSTSVRDWYLAQKDALNLTPVLESMRANVGSIQLDERAPPLNRVREDVLNNFAPSLVPPWDSETLHEPRVMELPFVRQEYLLAPAIAEALRDVFQMYLDANQPAAR
jgi:hypothetical protein